MVRRTSKKNEEKKVRGFTPIPIPLPRVNNGRRWLHEYMQNPVQGLPHCNEPCTYEGQERVMTFKMPDVTGLCSICHSLLTKDFPEDYPNDWKFCCSCQAWAKAIIRDWDEDWLVESLSSPTIKKIYEKIMVFGDERKK